MSQVYHTSHQGYGPGPAPPPGGYPSAIPPPYEGYPPPPGPPGPTSYQVWRLSVAAVRWSSVAAASRLSAETLA
ncbi:hypothetical protein Acr_06g0000330 [Actinidia rufa]|uniref:Uncharacterized protein n=1 Tax=Actinidia rufa TaxID=165716 RepID=A0A7J0ENL8_9ERIC|nr:hypothetical protein Acr_06g0000330 [Actinidia rufa]